MFNLKIKDEINSFLKKKKKKKKNEDLHSKEINRKDE